MTPSIRYRRAKPSDVQAGWEAVRRDWPLIPESARPTAPTVMSELLAEGRLFLVVFENAVTRTIVNMGCYMFPRPEFLRRAMTAEGRGIVEQILESEDRNQRVLLNWREVAQANASEAVELLSCLSTPDFDSPYCLAEIGAIIEAFSFFVRGYNFRAVWQENGCPRAVTPLVEMGYRTIRRVERQCGDVVSLQHLSIADAHPGSYVASILQAPQPRFGFTPREQALLELALLDWPDSEAAGWLEVTTDAVKKRWRAIYAKVRALEPGLFDGLRGGPSACRHAVLSRIRHNPQELRPRHKIP